MDSMRSLNTSLPKTRRRQPNPQPDTHKVFKDTALTVTNLYRTALADIERSRSDGYQQALEDLLGFLDNENLGVGDGEASEGCQVGDEAGEVRIGDRTGH